MGTPLVSRLRLDPWPLVFARKKNRGLANIVVGQGMRKRSDFKSSATKSGGVNVPKAMVEENPRDGMEASMVEAEGLVSE